MFVYNIITEPPPTPKGIHAPAHAAFFLRLHLNFRIQLFTFTPCQISTASCCIFSCEKWKVGVTLARISYG